MQRSREYLRKFPTSSWQCKGRGRGEGEERGANQQGGKRGETRSARLTLYFTLPPQESLAPTGGAGRGGGKKGEKKEGLKKEGKVTFPYITWHGKGERKGEKGKKQGRVEPFLYPISGGGTGREGKEREKGGKEKKAREGVRWR